LEPDDARALVFVEVASYGATHHFLKMGFIVGRSEDCVAEGAGCEAASGCRLDEKSNFAHGYFSRIAGLDRSNTCVQISVQ
jgi:hypothetical protein